MKLKQVVVENLNKIEESINHNLPKQSSFYGVDSSDKDTIDFIKSLRKSNPELYKQIVDLD